jgi:hypothetical protein
MTHRGMPSARGLVLLALALAWSASLAAGTRPDFSGRWALDAAHSVGLSPSQPRDVVLAIEQTADRLVVHRTAAGKSATTTMLFDGTEVVEREKGITVSKRSRWAAGALVSVGTQTRSMLGTSIVLSFTEAVRLEADGTMSVKTTMSGGGKERSRTSIYRRAPNMPPR